MTTQIRFRVTAAFMAASVFTSGTLGTAAVCQSLCAPAEQPQRAAHHSGMGHMHAHAANGAVARAGMSAPECSAQTDAQPQRRAANAPNARQLSTQFDADALPQFAVAAAGEADAVTGSPPDLTIPSRANPLRV